MVQIVIGVPPTSNLKSSVFFNIPKPTWETHWKVFQKHGKPDPLEEQHGYDGMPPKRCDVNQTINSSTTIRPLFVIEFQFHFHTSWYLMIPLTLTPTLLIWQLKSHVSGKTVEKPMAVASFFSPDFRVVSRDLVASLHMVVKKSPLLPDGLNKLEGLTAPRISCILPATKVELLVENAPYEGHYCE